MPATVQYQKEHTEYRGFARCIGRTLTKYQTTVSDEIEAKMLSLFGLGISYRDIVRIPAKVTVDSARP